MYYVNQDWNLPIGYVFAPEPKHSPSGSSDFVNSAPFCAAIWFRGTEQITNDVAGYLFYQGKVIGDTKTTEHGTVSDEVSDLCTEPSEYEWRRKRFWFNTVFVFDKQPQTHPSGFPLYKNPGKYEIKMLQNGHLSRTARFEVNADGKIIDKGIARSQLGRSRTVIPVQVIGDQDGRWDREARKGQAFYGDPLPGFEAAK